MIGQSLCMSALTLTLAGSASLGKDGLTRKRKKTRSENWKVKIELQNIEVPVLPERQYCGQQQNHGAGFVEQWTGDLGTRQF